MSDIFAWWPVTCSWIKWFRWTLVYLSHLPPTTCLHDMLPDSMLCYCTIMSENASHPRINVLLYTWILCWYWIPALLSNVEIGQQHVQHSRRTLCWHVRSHILGWDRNKLLLVVCTCADSAWNPHDDFDLEKQYYSHSGHIVQWCARQLYMYT